MSPADTATTCGLGAVPTVETALAAASTRGGLADGPRYRRRGRLVRPAMARVRTD
jgi:hypothetical protein